MNQIKFVDLFSELPCVCDVVNFSKGTYILIQILGLSRKKTTFSRIFLLLKSWIFVTAFRDEINRMRGNIYWDWFGTRMQAVGYYRVRLHRVSCTLISTVCGNFERFCFQACVSGHYRHVTKFKIKKRSKLTYIVEVK